MAGTKETTDQSRIDNQPSSQVPPQSVEGEESAELVEKKRLDGALQKIQELTLANKALAEQLATKDVALGQTSAQIAQKEAEFQQKTGEFQSTLQNLQREREELARKAAEAEAVNRKLTAIKAAGRPELVAIIDTIPVAQSDEEQIQVVNKLAGFADDIVKRREKELIAGLGDGSHSIAAGGAAPAKPTTHDGWMNYINSLKPGSLEHQKAWDEYFVAAQKLQN
jgi:chromosome segregation ATPase